MIYARVLILLALTGLQIYFCYKAGTWVQIPIEMWAVGLVCGGDKAIDLISRIRLLASDENGLPNSKTPDKVG